MSVRFKVGVRWSVALGWRRLRDELPRGLLGRKGRWDFCPHPPPPSIRAASLLSHSLSPSPWAPSSDMRNSRGCVLLLSAAAASLYFLQPPSNHTTPTLLHSSLSASSLNNHSHHLITINTSTRPQQQSHPGGSAGPAAPDLLRTQSIFKCRPLAYRNPPRPPVALVSFPGSGNTWLRYLLQLSTGVFTGSVYKDFALLRNGFPGESVTGGSVLVVKTHESGPGARAPFAKAILLIRKPSEAILAEFNRRAAGHIGHAGRDKYTRNAGRYWASFVAQKGKSWTETNLDWIEGFEGPLAITLYANLVANTSAELGSLLTFLDESVDEEVARCVERNKEGIYRRRKRGLPFNPFTPKMERFLAAQERIVEGAIARRYA